MSVPLNLAADAASREDIEQLPVRSHRFEDVVNLYVVAEVVGVGLVAFMAARLYWRQGFDWVPPVLDVLVPSAAVALIVGIVNVRGGRMASALSSGPIFMWSALRAILIAFATIVTALFVLKISDVYSRGMLLSQLVAVAAAILFMRAIFQKYLRTQLARGALETERVIVIGSLARDGAFLGRLLKAGNRIVSAQTLEGVLQDGSSTPLVKDLVKTCRSWGVARVVIALPAQHSGIASDIVEGLAETPVTVNVVLPGVQCPVFRSSANSFHGLATAEIDNRPLNSWDLAVKRIFDIAVSFSALVLLAPLLTFVAIAIRLDSPGPVLFRQTRHGYGNRAIRVIKFRSMRVVEDGAAFRQATRNDPRITRIGRFIRRTNLDELPQLFNVLLGEMSIVGPRPHPIALNETFADQIKWFNRRHNIKPGITGWAQVNGYRGETKTLDRMEGRVAHDLWYLENWSFLLDLKIMIVTVFSPLAYRDAR